MPERGAPSNIRTYRDLVAWQKGMALAELVYRATADLPPEEKFGLVSQMRRAAVSIPANIAEGFGRAGKVEFRRYLEISRGSLFELQTHAELARRLGWLKGQPLSDLRGLARELDAVLMGLLRSVKARQS
jgi:four helix bundle protein